jgi:hypothetical protein
MALTDDTREGRICLLRYNFCKQAVLRMHIWNCAMTRVSLAPLTEAPAFEFTYQFQMPVNLLRLVSWSADELRIEGRKMLCDDSTLEIRYVFDQVESEFDILLSESIACYLAWDISYPLVQSGALRDDLWKAFRKIMPLGKMIDAQEETADAWEANTYTDARRQ